MDELYRSAHANPHWLPMAHFFRRFPTKHMFYGTADEQKYFNDMHVEAASDYDIWLVPIAFFHHIQQREFWEDHLSKYGIDVFRSAMTLSSNMMFPFGIKKVEQPSTMLIAKEINTIQCTIAFDKYNRAKEAQMAIMAHHHQLELARVRSREPAVGDDDHNADDHEDGGLIVPDINNDGWEDFISMVKIYRYELALDTHQRVSEHIFLDYINRICDRPVERKDFRRFLLLCNTYEMFFWYATISCVGRSKQ